MLVMSQMYEVDKIKIPQYSLLLETAAVGEIFSQLSVLGLLRYPYTFLKRSFILLCPQLREPGCRC